MKKGPLGWLVGIVTGTLVGVLFAPKKGDDLRKNLQKERAKGGSGVDTLKNAYKGLGKEIAGSAKDAYRSEEVQKAVSKAKKGLNKVKKDAEDFIHESMEQIEGMATDAKKKGEKIVKKKINTAKKAVKKVVKKEVKKAVKKAPKKK